MANRRLISSEIWEDEYVGTLSFFERLLWIGLFSSCADDQGRIVANPAVIRSKIFPFDDVSLEYMQTALNGIVSSGKVLAYEAGGKVLYQIVHWWTYQSPSWAQPSKYPAPDGWVDRIKYHGPNRKIITYNWEMSGGFSSGPVYIKEDSSLPSAQGSALPSAQGSALGSGQGSALPKGIRLKEEEEEEEDVHSDDNVVVSSSDDETGSLSPLSAAFVNATGIPELTGGPEKWTKSLEKMQAAGVAPEDVDLAVQELRDKGYQIVGIQSIVNPAISCMSRRLAKPRDAPAQLLGLRDPDGNLV